MSLPAVFARLAAIHLPPADNPEDGRRDSGNETEHGEKDREEHSAES